ncbi:CPBP family intramembrane metalloprotease [Candidatus Gracilibacteria bacterium]|nr:CPBP family intramembrane metalloprotease [Candidatus Gracilibacteria bacterium]
MSNNLQAAPWSLKDLAIILALTTILAVATTFATLKFFPSIASLNETHLLLITFITQWLIFLTPLLIFTAKKHRLELTHFAINKIALKHCIKQAIFAYLAYIAIALTIVTLKETFHLTIPGFGEQAIFQDLGEIQQNAFIILLIVSFLAPILEEIFFRGFILRTLANKMPTIIASILTAAIFSLLHYPWQSFGQILLIGLILNHLTIRNNSVLPGVAFHILNNTIAFAILLNL